MCRLHHLIYITGLVWGQKTHMSTLFFEKMDYSIWLSYKIAEGWHCFQSKEFSFILWNQVVEREFQLDYGHLWNYKFITPSHIFSLILFVKLTELSLDGWNESWFPNCILFTCCSSVASGAGTFQAQVFLRPSTSNQIYKETSNRIT